MKKYKNQVEDEEQARRVRHARGGPQIAEVHPDSPAARAGIEPGWRLLTINDEPAHDSIQLKLAATGRRARLQMQDQSGQLQQRTITVDASGHLGVHVDAELFDGVRRCTNKCPFCFVDQLPDRLGPLGLRRTLYVRDDDYRLSFLHGHYITLSNLKPADFARIIRDRLSPLYVSVHATDPALRQRMVGHPGDNMVGHPGDDVMAGMRYLISHGITLNTQIVLCPGWNDGPHLDRSLTDLLSLWPGVESLAVVPVGLTRFMPPERGLRPVRPEEAAAVLHQVRATQRRALNQEAGHFAYASDEMYLLAGQAVPSTAAYEGFPQFANGVGMLRVFQDELRTLARRRPAPEARRPPRVTLVTGRLAAPALRRLAEVLAQLNLARADVAEISSTFWGGNVTCSGLIMGQEILQQVPPARRDLMLLPPDAVDNQGRLLDDVTVAHLEEHYGVPVQARATGPLAVANLLSQLPAAPSPPHASS